MKKWEDTGVTPHWVTPNYVNLIAEEKNINLSIALTREKIGFAKVNALFGCLKLTSHQFTLSSSHCKRQVNIEALNTHTSSKSKSPRTYITPDLLPLCHFLKSQPITCLHWNQNFFCCLFGLDHLLFYSNSACIDSIVRLFKN